MQIILWPLKTNFTEFLGIPELKKAKKKSTRGGQPGGSITFIFGITFFLRKEVQGLRGTERRGKMPKGRHKKSGFLVVGPLRG